MPILDFTLVCVPPRTSHHAKRIVRVGAFSRLADKPELIAAKEMLDTLLLPHQPSAPVPGPVTLVLEFTWPWLVSHGQRVRARGRIPHTSRPDSSNTLKTIEDRLVALRFIEDDRGIAGHHLQKWWGSNPGIRIVLAPFVPFDVSALALGLIAPAVLPVRHDLRQPGLMMVTG